MTETLTRQTDIESLLPLKEVLIERARLQARETFLQESLSTLRTQRERFAQFEGVAGALDVARVGQEAELPGVQEACQAAHKRVEHEGWAFLKKALGADRGVCIRPPRGGDALRMDHLAVSLEGGHVHFVVTGARVDQDGLPLDTPGATWAFRVKNVRDQVALA